MSTYQAVVTVQQANSERFPKEPFILTPYAGQVPSLGKEKGSAYFLAKEIAQNAGLKVGVPALVMFTEREPSAEYGRQFNIQVVKNDLSLKELGSAVADFGKPLMVDCTIGTKAYAGVGGFADPDED